MTTTRNKIIDNGSQQKKAAFIDLQSKRDEKYSNASLYKFVRIKQEEQSLEEKKSVNAPEIPNQIKATKKFSRINNETNETPTMNQANVSNMKQ